MCLNFTGSADNRINDEPKCQFKCHIFEVNAEDQVFGRTKKRSGSPGWLMVSQHGLGRAVWKRTQLTRSWLTSSIYCWWIFIFHHCWLRKARFIPDLLLARPQEVMPLIVSTAFLSQVTQVSLPKTVTLNTNSYHFQVVVNLITLTDAEKGSNIHTQVSNAASGIHKIQHLHQTIKHLRIYDQDQHSEQFQEAVCLFSSRRTMLNVRYVYRYWQSPLSVFYIFISTIFVHVFWKLKDADETEQ